MTVKKAFNSNHNSAFIFAQVQVIFPLRLTLWWPWSSLAWPTQMWMRGQRSMPLQGSWKRTLLEYPSFHSEYLCGSFHKAYLESFILESFGQKEHHDSGDKFSFFLSWKQFSAQICLFNLGLIYFLLIAFKKRAFWFQDTKLIKLYIFK